MASEGKSFEVEFFDKDPDKELFVQHTPAGDSVTALDGNSGWANAPGRPMRDLSGSDLDAARADADLQFPLHMKQMFPELRVEYPEQVDGRETYVVVGSREAGPSWKFYFDAASALLVRVVRFAESPLGLDPTQIDYKDFRAIDGVQTPFHLDNQPRGKPVNHSHERDSRQHSDRRREIPETCPIRRSVYTALSSIVSACDS